MENGGRGSGGVELRMTNLRFFFPKSKLAHNHRKRKALMLYEHSQCHEVDFFFFFFRPHPLNYTRNHTHNPINTRAWTKKRRLRPLTLTQRRNQRAACARVAR
jgi:hypothetical protein